MSDLSVVQFYKLLIEACETQLARIRNLTNAEKEAGGKLSLSLNVDAEDLSKKQLDNISSQLDLCTDPDLLAALCNEFKRQLKAREPPVPPPLIRSSSQEPQAYFMAELQEGGITTRKYYHFDGQRIARELILSDSIHISPTLLVAGRDDTKMCQWNLEEAKITEYLDLPINESEFNTNWYQHGGCPYIRPSRMARRLLVSALFKKM